MRNHKRGFTLIELLVVVAIIAVLIAILLPAISAAREMAKRTLCGANLKTIALGYLTYAHDNGQFPAPLRYSYGASVLQEMEGAMATELNRDLGQRDLTDPPAGHSFVQDIQSYQFKDLVWLCPSVSHPEDHLSMMYWKDPSNPSLGQKFQYIDYIFQTGLNPSPWRYWGTLSPLKAEDPIGPLVADRISSGWNMPQPPTFWTGNHPGGGRFGVAGLNQLYSDGHVRWHSTAEIRSDAPETMWSWMYAAGSDWPHYFWVEKP
jgi:prepilin-type N-terminal cleavage/methylation domain-containing protein